MPATTPIAARGRVLASAAALSLTLAACGASDPQQASATTAPARSAAAVKILAPKPGARHPAQAAGRGRLSAVVKLSGTAEPGVQLTVEGRCGGKFCSGITFTSVRGRWHTKLRLTTPRDRREVAVRVGYSDSELRGRSATLRVRLKKAPAPVASPTPEVVRRPPEAAGPTGGAAAPSGATGSGPRPLVSIGDSLAVGMARPLAAQLAGWPVSTDARIGRPLAEGMEVLRETELPTGEGGRSAVLAMSLFTNDAPTGVAALEGAVRESVERVGPGGCAIWATISRPPYRGMGYGDVNARLHQLATDPGLAGRLIVVPWAEQLREHPEWRAADRIHATPAGYEGRAALYAQAARSCPA